MADTIVQECIKCGYETDCINGICQECFLELPDDIDPDYEDAKDAYESKFEKPK